jgi:hypothetical protein
MGVVGAGYTLKTIAGLGLKAKKSGWWVGRDVVKPLGVWHDKKEGRLTL